MVIIDTSIIIDHLRQPANRSRLLWFLKKHHKETLGISIISIQELYEGQSTLDEEKEKDLLATIAPLKIFPYTYEVAKKAGEIAQDLARAIELADATIAATAIIENANLFTLDKNDFKGIKNLITV